MTTPLQYRRLIALAFLLIAALVALGFRLVDLQVARHHQLKEEAEDKTRRTYFREPRRGDIRDVRGNILARSYFVKTVCANPHFISGFQQEVARALAPVLQMNEAELIVRLQPRLLTNSAGRIVPDQYEVLKRKVSLENWEHIQMVMRNLELPIDEKKLTRRERRMIYNLREKAIFADAQDDQIRVYPNQSLAAHVLGFVGTQTRETTSGKIDETVGLEGIEAVFNSALSGMRGWKSTIVDHRSRELVAWREQDVAARAGLNVVLTLDAGLQHIVETELADVMQKHTPISASCVVVRPKTGEVLAMATLPNFDPGHLNDTTADARRNRVICDVAEPGSTFKIVVVSGALQEGLVSLEEAFDCEHGRTWFAGRSLRDDHSFGVLTVQNIIAKSSNIGAFKVGLRLGELRLHKYMMDFGFGQRTGIQLLGEVRGTVHPINRWNKLSISRIPMGHEVTATPLQMVMAMSAIANGGRLMQPLIVDRVEDDEGHVMLKYAPRVVRQVISESTSRQMVAALKAAVSTNGTAVKARLDHYTVAGKTGTAQKAIGGHYVPGKYFSSFIGFFPAEDPELCISVVLDEPKNGYYGGGTVAPVFRNIAERASKYFAIPPDIKPTEPEPGHEAQRSLSVAKIKTSF
jgi:cell division protein FtsI/penicillin-binding protein 2